jgi:hypothetical protein
MPEREVAPNGSWRSPISSDMIVRGVVGLSEVAHGALLAVSI